MSSTVINCHRMATIVIEKARRALFVPAAVTGALLPRPGRDTVTGRGEAHEYGGENLSMTKWHMQVHADFGLDTRDDSSWDHVKTLIGWLNGKDRTEVFIGDVGRAVQRFLVVSGG
jgi:hypothetical protein